SGAAAETPRIYLAPPASPPFVSPGGVSPKSLLSRKAEEISLQRDRHGVHNILDHLLGLVEARPARALARAEHDPVRQDDRGQVFQIIGQAIVAASNQGKRLRRLVQRHRPARA